MEACRRKLSNYERRKDRMVVVYILSALMVALMVWLLLAVTKKAYSKKWDEE
ncbi:MULTISPECIES: hypothetical protein [unclassified Paenibacillus]|uniref:hypothetical protein n=1 Tax=unclassified Paenibacillus TaxID=185978 RepID=UPI0012FD6208|nr:MULTISPECIES: hypothetical protein [unclassified Paenibacillus]QID16018.1 hypothetical protein CIC07_25455 [Paenibacillus sp. RUD330]